MISKYVSELARRYHQFGAAVLSLTGGRSVGVNRIGFAARNGLDPSGIDALRNQAGLDSVSACLAESDVGSGGSPSVGVAGDADARITVLLENGRDGRHFLCVARTQRALCRIEGQLFELECRGAASVPLR